MVMDGKKLYGFHCASRRSPGGAGTPWEVQDESSQAIWELTAASVREAFHPLDAHIHQRVESMDAETLYAHRQAACRSLNLYCHEWAEVRDRTKREWSLTAARVTRELGRERSPSRSDGMGR